MVTSFYEDRTELQSKALNFLSGLHSEPPPWVQADGNKIWPDNEIYVMQCM